jgi:accessory gene regulator protein AgrB
MILTIISLLIADTCQKQGIVVGALTINAYREPQ